MFSFLGTLGGTVLALFILLFCGNKKKNSARLPLSKEDADEVIKVQLPHPQHAAPETIDEFLQNETRIPVLLRYRQIAGTMEMPELFLEKIEHRIEEEIRKQRS